MKSALLAVVLVAALCSPPASAQQGESPDQMKDANRAAALLLRERLMRDRRADHILLRQIRPDRVLVVRGEYDHLEWVLGEVGIRYETAGPEELSRRDLRGYRVILVNCPGRVAAADVRRLRDHTHAGGYLFTTDWAVRHVLESAFPGTIRFTGRPTRDDVVGIEALLPEHDCLRQVMTGGHQHVWWLENRSYPIEVLDRRRVRVLIGSEEMRRKYGAGPIAATFPAGRGQVLHIVSHSYLQRSELRVDADRRKAPAFAEELGFSPASGMGARLEREGLADVPAGELRSAYSAQQLLVNFILEAFRRPVPPPEADPTPPPPPPPAEGLAAHLARDERLRVGPGGEAVRAVPAGLRLSILEVRRGWLRVRTPAGAEGWLPAEAVSR